MDYGMIGKIEKAKQYASEPERVTFNSLTVEFRGDNDTYTITLGPDGWDSTSPSFRRYGICPHVMTLERLFKPMLKRQPLPYASGQNVVSDVEKATRYAQEPDRIRFVSYDATFAGTNGTHHVSFGPEGWFCDTDFFRSRGVDSHTMAMEHLLKGMLPPTPAPAAAANADTHTSESE
ncbi:MAG: hypothetical protein GYB67_19735 [Chloroflexi bacterium]|nr:hypothetical protein [Chloroflexota bacterium]